MLITTPPKSIYKRDPKFVSEYINFIACKIEESNFGLQETTKDFLCNVCFKTSKYIEAFGINWPICTLGTVIPKNAEHNIQTVYALLLLVDVCLGEDFDDGYIERLIVFLFSLSSLYNIDVDTNETLYANDFLRYILTHASFERYKEKCTESDLDELTVIHESPFNDDNMQQHYLHTLSFFYRFPKTEPDFKNVIEPSELLSIYDDEKVLEYMRGFEVVLLYKIAIKEGVDEYPFIKRVLNIQDEEIKKYYVRYNTITEKITRNQLRSLSLYVGELRDTLEKMTLFDVVQEVKKAATLGYDFTYELLPDNEDLEFGADKTLASNIFGSLLLPENIRHVDPAAMECYLMEGEKRKRDSRNVEVPDDITPENVYLYFRPNDIELSLLHMFLKEVFAIEGRYEFSFRLEDGETLLHNCGVCVNEMKSVLIGKLLSPFNIVEKENIPEMCTDVVLNDGSHNAYVLYYISETFPQKLREYEDWCRNANDEMIKLFGEVEQESVTETKVKMW